MIFDSPGAAEAAFYRAFAKLDLAEMRAVWIHSGDASCMHPGAELLQGSEEIMASWASIFDNSQAPQVEHRLIRACTDQNLAVHTVAETVSAGSGRSSALIVATNVYTRAEGGSWRILAHHTSLPLVEPNPDSGQEQPHALH